LNTTVNMMTVVWCLSLGEELLPATPPDALWGPPSCFTVAECEWCRTLTSVLIVRMHGSIPPLHSESSGIVPSVQSLRYQQFLNHYQHFILKVFSHICWQEMNCDWNTVEKSPVISKLMIYILQSSFIFRCKRSNFIQ